MEGLLGAEAGTGLSFSMDRILMNIHGNADSHLDALCHVIFDGELYNGVAADTVGEGGAAELSVGLAADGIVGRGVLLDVPRSRGVRSTAGGGQRSASGAWQPTERGRTRPRCRCSPTGRWPPWAATGTATPRRAWSTGWVSRCLCWPSTRWA